jgi:GT2 family glycosyltransferase
LGLITVVIVNWNGGMYIRDCLNSLEKQNVSEYSIILVDNGSSDGSLELVRENFAEVQIIPLEKNLGFAVGNNIALKEVSTEFVALLNNDAMPDNYWLANLVSALENHPDVGFAASKMLLYHKPDQIDRAGDVFTTAGTALLRGRGTSSTAFDKKEYVFGACAGAALYRTEMLRDIGLFDEDFFLLYEDVDLSFRAQLRGYKCIYVPEAVVYHVGSGSIGDDTPTSVYYSHRNLEWVYIKNMPGSLIKKSIASHLIYDLAALFYFAVKGRGGIYLKAKWDALRGIRKALEKRRNIQENKKVLDDYIWNLLDKEKLLPRLTRRLRLNRSS